MVFVNDEGQILGNLGDAQYISRATALIQQSHFKGTLGKSVTDYALDDQASPAISIVGVGKLDKLADNIAKVAVATYDVIKILKVRQFCGVIPFAKFTLHNLSPP